MNKGDLRIILRDLGWLAPVPGLMALLSLPVAAAFGEWYAVAPLLITAGVSFALSLALYLPLRRAGEAKLRHGLLVAAVGWALVSTLGALPFYLISLNLPQGYKSPFTDFASAFFESVSGYTGTGLTMATRPDLLPRVLQWWRSFIEWVGGMGVIVLMLTLIVGPGTSVVSLYFAEARTERIHPSVLSTVRTMWWIFALYTVISVVTLWGVGMPLWEALNHAMTGISTGGFTVWPDSIAHYDSVPIDTASIFIMLAGAISFAVHYRALRGRLRALAVDLQTRWLLAISLVGVVLVSLENLLAGYLPADSFRKGAFQFVSALTCTGFQTAPIGEWPDKAKFLLSLGMVIGGAAGSTAGGIKVMRFVLLVRGVSWRLRKIVSPGGALVPMKLGRELIPDAEASKRLEEAAVLTFLWFAFLFFGILVLSHLVPSEYGLADVIFEVASAQGNVGLSVGITGPDMPTVGKLLLCFNMWVGRLEIIPVLMFLRSFFLRRW